MSSASQRLLTSVCGVPLVCSTMITNCSTIPTGPICKKPPGLSTAARQMPLSMRMIPASVLSRSGFSTTSNARIRSLPLMARRHLISFRKSWFSPVVFVIMTKRRRSMARPMAVLEELGVSTMPRRKHIPQQLHPSRSIMLAPT